MVLYDFFFVAVLTRNPFHPINNGGLSHLTGFVSLSSDNLSFPGLTHIQYPVFVPSPSLQVSSLAAPKAAMPFFATRWRWYLHPSWRNTAFPSTEWVVTGLYFMIAWVAVCATSWKFPKCVIYLQVFNVRSVSKLVPILTFHLILAITHTDQTKRGAYS